jgi:uncharacterized membrane protein YcfT
MDDRVDWIDYAKGVCILAVVTLYSTAFVQEIARSVGWMQHVVDFAQPFRMPDFFLIAGLFVSRVLNRPLRAYIDSKVLYFVYFYAIWVTLKFINMEWSGLLQTHPHTLLSNYLWLYIEPPTGPLWFIYILAFFFAAARLLRSVPVPLVLAGAIMLEVADMATGVKLFDKFADYFVYFYSGYALSRNVFRAAEWARSNARFTLAVLVLWFAANSILVALGWDSLPGVMLLMGYAGAAAIMLFSTLLTRISWMRWLGHLGQNSMVVYLGFVIPLGLMRRFVAAPALITDVGALSLTVMIVSVSGAIFLYWAVRPTPLRFLFERPAWLTLEALHAFAAKRSLQYRKMLKMLP